MGVTAANKPGLIGSETSSGCCGLFVALAVLHRWPVPFWPSNGRFVKTTEVNGATVVAFWVVLSALLTAGTAVGIDE